ncbi:hypothetical protein [Arthrobacter sp. TB 23]|uniref:hypothetical protein n=1 Tax=Arthrobacter sp. TB 23 TaxID=494419 RepID=UPI00035F3A1C|nr:hypothetical protein [Arthrobacter sp. TB 23]
MAAPAGTTLVSTAILTTTAWFLIRHHDSWTSKVILLAGLVSVTALLVVSHLYPAGQQPTDTILAWAAGTIWALGFSALMSAPRAHQPRLAGPAAQAQ